MSKKLHLPLSALLLLNGHTLSAQISLDGSLGKSNTLAGPNYQIGANLGSQHGGNLFHSFRDFNLQNHESATFTGPANVSNIISRVTGGKPSSIDGTIRSKIPNANMYFVNPSGIMFGPNAKLDVQGSFHASTADILRFEGGGTQVSADPSSPMLVIAPATTFGFLTNAPAPIITQDSILTVPEGKTLSLIGGELRLTGTSPPQLDEHQQWINWKSVLSAPAGRINLASLASSGEVSLSDTGLELSPTSQRGSLTAANTLIVSNRLHGGDIFIRAGQLKLSRTNIETANWTADAKKTGQIDIEGEALELDGSEITTASYGSGAAGNVTLKLTGDLTLFGVRSPGSSVIASHAQQGQRAGQLNLQARQVKVQAGSKIVTDTEGTGPGGAIAIQTETLEVTGTDSLGQPSRIYTDTLSPDANAGPGGEIKVKAETMTVDNYGQVESRSGSSGAGGNLDLNAKTVAVTDQGLIHSSTTGMGAGGTVTVNTDQLTMSGRIESQTQNSGAGGNLELTAKTVTVTDPGVIHSSTSGAGAGGTVTVKTDQLTVTGRIESRTQNAGAGGNLELTSPNVAVTDQGVIHSSTTGAGAGGAVTVKTDQLTVTGRLESQSQNVGPGGNLELTANTVAVTDPGVIHSSTTGTGAGGTITLNADQLTMSGRLESQSQHSGQGGHLNVTANTVALTDPGVIHSSTTGAGAGGRVTVNTDQLTVTGRVESHSQHSGAGGNLEVNANTVAITDSGVIHSSTTGAGAGGTVTVKTDQLTLTGQIESQSQHSGPGGNLEVNTKTMAITNSGVIHSSTTGTGAGGRVTVTADQLTLTGRIESQSQHSGAGGNLAVTANTVAMTNPGVIHSSTTGAGAGGTVTMNTDQMTMTEGDINSVTSADGAGGAIQLNARSLTLLQGSTIETHTKGRGPGGLLSLGITDSLKLSGTSSNRYPSRIATGSWFRDERVSDASEGGNLEITAGNLTLSERGQITAFTHGTGKGGALTINVRDKLAIQGTRILDTAQSAMSDEYPKTSGIFNRSFDDSEDAGYTGNLTITATDVELLKGGEIATVARRAGGGNLQINVTHRLLLQDSILVAFLKEYQADSGSITIGRPSSLVLNNSRIFSSVEVGRAGDVQLAADQMMMSSQSSLNASFRLQIDAPISSSSPDEDLCPDALLLPSKPLNAENLIKTPCNLRQNTSSFIITEREGVSEPLDDWLPSGLPRWQPRVRLDSLNR